MANARRKPSEKANTCRCVRSGFRRHDGASGQKAFSGTPKSCADSLSECQKREGGEIALLRGPSHLVAVRALALAALPIPGTSALTAFAKVWNTPTDPASR